MMNKTSKLWISFCSAHQKRDYNCPTCNAGHYMDVSRIIDLKERKDNVFAKTGNNDWVDYVVFGLVFLLFLAFFGITLGFIGVHGFSNIILSIVGATIGGFWAMQGEPEDLWVKHRTKFQKKDENK